MIVCKAVTTPIDAMHDLDALVIRVDVFNICHNKLSTFDHLANGVRNRRDVEIARRNFMKHWRKEDKVVTTDQLEYCLVRTKKFLELPCYFDSGESAAQNQYLWRPLHFGILSDPVSAGCTSVFIVIRTLYCHNGYRI